MTDETSVGGVDALDVRRDALGPLFEAWEEPRLHRVRAERGDGAVVRQGRRPSSIVIAHNLRAMVKEWRDNFYFGASDTSRHLLNHWFGRAHEVNGSEFRYYFCQREAIETLIYLKEVRRLECLSQMIAEFGGSLSEASALGVTPEDDAWSRYAFKMATGSGKTKVMSLAIVWSYFHALRESDSPLARHFVVVAPNLTVFERLKEDFKPEGGGADIFDRDPLIPSEWRGDWNLTTVLQDEAGGAATGGVLYLTNIHRLFDNARRKKDTETYDWIGPAVSKAKALDTGAELRERITGHARVMVMNDEAHHVWDPDSAWNEAITYLHDTIRKRTGGGLTAQLDFSATPKDNQANYFKHIVCDTPLGEAVDAGIVKTPIIGKAGQLIEQATDNAAWKYEMHLKLGYERWLKSREEWQQSGKKPLLFIMCEDTQAADQIAARLNSDGVFKELNGHTINLHTNLKGKIKKVGRGADAREEFVESEKDISDEDMKALRKLSRDLDSGSSPYMCIVSVLVLREGWDVRNVTTIVPLRPYSSKAGILPEQTLGRGLRRMTPPGQANEVVAVIEHEAFARLYRDELAQEGLPLEIVDAEKVPATTVSIFPDGRKNIAALDIQIPRLSAGNMTLSTLEKITPEEVKAAFARYPALPLGKVGQDKVQYEGQHLITGEIVERMNVHLALLESGYGAISFFKQELEHICKVKGTHTVLAPLLEMFLEDLLFGKKVSLSDRAVVQRLGSSDVREYVRQVFIPLVREKTIRQQARIREPEVMPVSGWRPFQVTVSERRPVRPSDRTVFNLVSCNRALETAFVQFCDKAGDVAAFAKNAGPQCLRIDYLSAGGRLAFYTPDFFVRLGNGTICLVETKGQVDKDVPLKARAACEWSKAASTKTVRWDYAFVPEVVFQRYQGSSMAELVRMCGPALSDLVNQEKFQIEMPLFASAGMDTLEQQPAAFPDLVDPTLLKTLPDRYRKAADEATALFRFFESKETASYAPVFTALLGAVDDAARVIMMTKLKDRMPANMQEQRDWFEPHYRNDIDRRTIPHYDQTAKNLRRTLVYGNGVSPLGLLRSCLDFALNDNARIAGVFEAIKEALRFTGGRKLLDRIAQINDFRNTRVAHQEQPLTDRKEAEKTLREWIEGLSMMRQVYADTPE